MKELFGQYLTKLYQDVPQEVYVGLLALFCFGAVIIIACCGLKHGWRKIVGLLLAEYVFVIYCSTVIFRTAADGNGHEFEPFWSYKAIENGRVELLAENMMNVVVFVPVGILLGLTCHNVRWWQVSYICFLISVSIETMQYFLHRGFAETDDVMHNTLGCLIGYGIYSLVKIGYERI